MAESFLSMIPDEQKMDEVQNYMDYIKGMGIEAWIPDSPGYGPKLSVADQCKSGVLCLTYLETDIYIRGKVTGAMDRGVPEGFVENTNPAQCQRSSAMLTDQMNDSTENVCDLLNASVTSSKRSVGGQSKIGSAPIITPRCLEKSAQRATKNCENKSFVPDIGYSYKRVVHEKLSREVRVAKCYVSSLPNTDFLACGQDERPGDRKEPSSDGADGSAKATRRGPRRGFVRQLIKRFDEVGLLGSDRSNIIINENH